MKQFLYKITTYLLLALLVFASLRIGMYYIHIKDTDTKNFNSAFVDKLNMLKAARAEKKIVLYGGSSVFFGLSAGQIEKATGIRTINLGHHAGFGLVDFRDFILNNLNADDILVFSPEWHFYYTPEAFDEATLANLVNNNVAYGRLLNKPDYTLRALLIYPTEFSAQYPPYIYKCLNNNGDITLHCNLASQTPLSYSLSAGPFDFNYFSETFPFIKNQNTIILFPPTQQHVFNTYKANLQSIENTLRRRHIRLADALAGNVYPETNFFDATYHLDCTTRAARTDSLIKNLQRLLNTPLPQKKP